ncbi:class I SAM-dependent methyltransferase [Candidatus Methylomirabilis sp.]|uniref:class I SAM-dependent methyltransferase n=1 Tax=Candidatus Methylomirabilis sp. TaxID=2032687 RepID=UPI0030762EE3
MTELLNRLEKSLEVLEARHERSTSDLAKQVGELEKSLEVLEARHERSTSDLAKQVGELEDHSAVQHRTSEESAAKYVELSRHFEDLRQEMILQKRRLDLILTELRNKSGNEGESVAKLVSLKDRLMDHSYFLFENRYRGSREGIKKRQEAYVPIFQETLTLLDRATAAMPLIVLDVGCGRGEFLELLRENGVPAKGIDVNEDMVYVCQERGLDVEQTSAIDYLRALSDDSLAGIIACQFIEHLSTEDMIELVKLCHRKLVSGGRAVFETMNPLSILTSATNFYLDISHQKPIHPLAFQSLVETIGFMNSEIRFLSPYPEETRFLLLNTDDGELLKLNQNFTRLNDILFGYQDYAVICSK